MKTPLYGRIRLYTYLVIATLTVSFAVAAAAFFYYDVRIESQLDRVLRVHSRTVQLAASIREQLLPVRALLDTHHLAAGAHDESHHSDLEAVLSALPTALYIIKNDFTAIAQVQQASGDAAFKPVVHKIERQIAELERAYAAALSSQEAAGVRVLRSALNALLLSADQLRRLHHVAAEDLDLRTGELTAERNIILVSLVLVLAVLSVAALVSLMSQIRVTLARQEETDRSLLEREKSYRTLVETVPNGIIEADLTGTIFLANKAYERMVGRTDSEVIGEKAWAFVPGEEEKRRLEVQLGEMVRLGSAPSLVTTKLLRKDGTEADVEIAWACERDSRGNPTGLVAVISDVTARLQLEASLRQSQKMEAMGQLTGGVAHEFNNLLGIIQGNAELLADNQEADGSLLRPILRAAARGSNLTRHLLAFARQQPLHPRAIDIPDLLKGMSEMLDRALGESIDMEIRTDPSLSAVSADPTQLETALLNLALNARDAMPSGGKLRIECSNVHLDDCDEAVPPGRPAGEYVLVSLSDTGQGMSDEVLRHAFEPFYTTKQVGKGTGLGLAMVYGFVEQSGGHISIDSRPGGGTTVRLYLPRENGAVPTTEEEERTEVPRGHGESVLVVEDDREMRELVVTMLNGLGYRATEVSDVAAARAVLERGDSIDLVLSDVMLPGGINGVAFAREMLARDPQSKVILMSGYPDEVMKYDGDLGPDRIMLSKPFKRRELAESLRSVLG